MPPGVKMKMMWTVKTWSAMPVEKTHLKFQWYEVHGLMTAE